jgi:hypothetical protein
MLVIMQEEINRFFRKINNGAAKMGPTSTTKEEYAQLLRRGNFNPIFLEIAIRKKRLTLQVVRDYLDCLEEEIRQAELLLQQQKQ